MIHLYIGEGKGKTSAVTGMALRMLNNNQKVLLVSFLKDGNSGELTWLREHSNIINLYQDDLKGFVIDLKNGLYKEMVTKQLGLFNQAVKGANIYDMIILDEFTDVVTLDIIDISQAINGIGIMNLSCEVLITGHQVIDQLVEMSDYYTEFVSLKHPFTKGIKARKGIEY